MATSSFIWNALKMKMQSLATEGAATECRPYNVDLAILFSILVALTHTC